MYLSIFHRYSVMRAYVHIILYDTIVADDLEKPAEFPTHTS